MEGLYLKITEDFTPDAKEARFGGKDALIAVEKGDIIFDVKRVGSGWLYGKNLNSGKAGKFPAKCSSDFSGNDNTKPKSTISPFGLRKTEPRKSEAKEVQVPTKITGAGESAGNQLKRNIPSRPFKTFGKEPQKSEKPVDKDSSGDSGVVTEELAQIRKPVAKNRAEEDGSSDGSRARDNLSRGSLGQTANVKQPPSDKNAKKVVNTMEKAKDQPVMSSDQVPVDQQKAKSTEVKYGKVAKLPSTDHDQTSKSHNTGKDVKQLGAAVNVQENPLTKQLAKDVEEGIYQVPNVTLPPPKPPHVLPERVPHEYATPENDFSPPETPTEASKDHKTTKKTKKKPDKKQGSKLKQKAQEKKVDKPERKPTSRENVRVTESLSTGGRKEAIKPAKKRSCSAERCPKMKILFGIGLGFAVGVFCFLIIYLLFSRHVLTAVAVALTSGVIIAVVLGFLDATRLKCIVLLIFPSLCSSGAKLSLWILITYFLISGPLCNFIDNVRITALTRGCMMEPRNSSAEGKTMTAYLTNNIEKFEKVNSELGRYLNETLIENKRNNGGNMSSGLICMRQLFKAQNTCSLAFESIYKNCTTILKQSSLREERCRAFLSRRSVCQHLSESIIRTTCGSINSAHLKDLMKMTVILQKQPTPMVKSDNSTRNRTDQFNGVHLARVKIENFCHCLEDIKVLLVLLILVVLYEAYRYQKHYLVYNEFDNCYLTLHFKSIEDTRKASGANDGLVPLKKSELQKYVQPTSCRLSRAEKKSFVKYLIIFLVYATFALLLLLCDFFFYQAVTSKEPAVLDTTLSGCKGELKNPDDVHTIIISVLLGLLLLLIILQAYVLRLRRYIAARFYRTRERKRVTYLYYKLLEERKKFFKLTIEKINSVSEENDILNRLDAMLVLAHRFPAFGKVMEFLGLSLKRCMVCGTGLNRKYVTCDTEDCGAVYCRTCFWDVESNCLGCMSSSKLSSPSWGSTTEAADGKKSDHGKQV